MLPTTRELISRRSIGADRRVWSHQCILLDEQDGCICFQIHSLGFANDLQAFCRNVPLISQAQADDVEHLQEPECVLSSQVLRYQV